MQNNWKPWQKPQNCQELIQTLNLLPSNWSLTPLREKRAFREGWQNEPILSRDYLSKLIASGETKISQSGHIWQAYVSGYGLRTGVASGGLLAIDFDGVSSQKIFTALLGAEIEINTVGWTSGKTGRFQLLFQIPQEFQHILVNFNRLVLRNFADVSCKSGDLLEFRYNKCQSALPPSLHPETGNYRWLNAPWNRPVAILPEAIREFLEKRQHQKISSKPNANKVLSSDEQKLVSALYRIDPDCPYDIWLKIGMALYSEGDRYFDLWDEWSSRGVKYKPFECQRKWKSFKNTSVTIASVYYWAKNHVK